MSCVLLVTISKVVNNIDAMQLERGESVKYNVFVLILSVGGKGIQFIISINHKILVRSNRQQ